MNNPFDTIDQRLSNIEDILLDIKHKPKEIQSDKYYSLHEFSNKLGIHYQTTRNAIKDGRIKAKKFGERRMMIHSSELDRALSEFKSIKYKRI